MARKPKMPSGFNYYTARPFTMYFVAGLHQELFGVAEQGSQDAGFFDPESYWVPSNGFFNKTESKKMPFMRFIKLGTRNYIDIYVYNLGIHDEEFSAMVQMEGPDIKHIGNSDEVQSSEELIETVAAAMIDDPLWKTRNRQTGMRFLNPKRNNPSTGASVLGALVVGGIIGRSMKKK